MYIIEKLDTKSGYSNFDTIEKADAKEKTEFWHTEAFRTYVLIRVRLYIFSSECENVKSHSDENVGSKGLSVPKFCLFLCVRLLYSIKVYIIDMQQWAKWTLQHSPKENFAKRDGTTPNILNFRT